MKTSFIDRAKENYVTLQQETNVLYKKHFVKMPTEIEAHLSSVDLGVIKEVEKRISASTGLEFDLVIEGDTAVVSNNRNVYVQRWKDVAERMAKDKMHGNDDDKFAALMNAYANSAIFIEANEGETVEVNLLYLSGAANSLHQVFVNARKGSNLHIMEVHAGRTTAGSNALAGIMREVVVGEGANVELNSIHDENHNTTVLAFCKAFSSDGGIFQFNATYSGGSRVRARNVLEARGNKSAVMATEMIFGGNTQRFDINSAVVNKGSQTRTLLDSRAALENKSICMLKGLAKLVKGAQKARSYVHERGMLLDKSARIESMPDMSVDENNVKATHSSATAPIDPETAFYLGSRGISKEDVKKLVVSGFFTGCLSRVTSNAMRTLTMAAVNNRLAGMDGGFGRKADSKGLWSISNDYPDRDMFSGHYKYR